MDNFTSQGWTFKRQQDGSLQIATNQESGPFNSNQSQQQQVTIPADQVQHLIAYALSGDSQNTGILTKVRDLSKEYVTA